MGEQLMRAGVLHTRRAGAEIGQFDLGGRDNAGYRPQFQHKTAQPPSRAAVSAGGGRTAGQSMAAAAETAHSRARSAKWAARATGGAGCSRIRGGTIT